MAKKIIFCPTCYPELNKHDTLMAKLSGTRQLKMSNKFDNLFNFDTQETNTEINSDEDEDDLR